MSEKESFVTRRTGVGRVLYCDLITPVSFNNDPNQDKKWSVTVAVEKGGKEIEALLKAQAEMVQSNKPINFKFFAITDGAQQENAMWHNCWIVKATRKEFKANGTPHKQPELYGADARPLKNPEEEIYPGCFGQIALALYASENKKFRNPTIGAFLVGFQKASDGEPLRKPKGSHFESLIETESGFDIIEDEEISL